MNTSLIHHLSDLKVYGQKAFAVLIDPDKVALPDLPELVHKAESEAVDFLFVGGSLVKDAHIHRLVPQIKRLTEIPVILFPGSVQQIVPAADAILFLSLISGRNADLLIGQHVIAAPLLKQTKLEVLATGYMLVDSGRATTVSYISQTQPIPYDKPDIAACTALAGEMLGLGLIYMDGGSGAQQPVSAEMIQAVARQVTLPVIVGGGIRTVSDAERAWKAGAEVVVIGNGIEYDGADLLQEVARAKLALNQQTNALQP